ncbi:CapA family protein [Candidatus Palauibacter sp.]|uniref:CapA family protein n=1 Tax=Candidatus Palauibacter sp. TaxID=3101350 RepID=UPI003B593803
MSALLGVFLALAAAPVALAGQEITLVAVGDIEWSRTTKALSMYYDAPPSGRSNVLWHRGDGWIRVPYAASSASRDFLEAGLDTTLIPEGAHHLRAHHYGLSFDDRHEEARYPLRRTADLLRGADIAFANLETPLSDRARWSGAFRTPSAFADALAWAGIDIVATANNHALDAEGEGLLDTIDHLRRAGVGHAGTGRDLADARRPYVIERGGIRVAFLGYAQFVNDGGSSFATTDQSGVVPMDPLLIHEDIARVRAQADLVVLSFHWGIENSQDVHPGMRAFAHDVLDAGADVILGHHPHMPRGIEVHDGKPIVYSMGNFIFGHGHDYWMDNLAVRLHIGSEGVTRVDVLPIAGRGDALSQPYLLEGEAARTLLEDIRSVRPSSAPRSASKQTPGSSISCAETRRSFAGPHLGAER